jgi:hypothetical protein
MARGKDERDAFVTSTIRTCWLAVPQVRDLLGGLAWKPRLGSTPYPSKDFVMQGEAMKKTAGMKRLTGLAVCAGMLSLGCSGSSGMVGTTTGSTGKGGATGNSTFNLTAGTTGTSKGNGGNSTTSTSPDGTCGTTTADTKRAQADILIVLDRSDSMMWDLSSDNDCSGGGGNCTARLPAVVSGVGTVMDANPGIHWGLEVFPTPDTSTCATVSSTPQVGIAANTASTIKSLLGPMDTSLGTPTRSAIEAAIAYLKTVNDGNNKVILLATDGYPNCLNYSTSSHGGHGDPGGGGGGVGSDDVPGTAAVIATAKDAGFPVYVIGIGPGVSNLNTLAVAGGTGSYYPATSTAQLTEALSSIAKVVSATCTFKASTTPPDSGLVYVYVDKGYVKKDDSDGWKFDAADPKKSTIILTGSYCDDMMSGVTSQVQIVFGCPNVAPPSIIP